MHKRFIVLIIVSLLSSSFVFAEGTDDQGTTNDPNVHDRANACFEGGSMEGRCTTELDWIAGWYLIRFEEGIFSREQIPSWIIWVLPPEIIPDDLTTNSTVIDTFDITACFTNGSRSFFLTGELNTVSNTNSGNGTFDATNCSGVVSGGGDVYATITENGSVAANTACDSLGLYNVLGVTQWSAQGYNVPSNWWYCRLEELPPI